MRRTDFMQIIKLRSAWKIDKRKGNYILPNGEKLSTYVAKLVDSQMKIDNLGILESGDLCTCSGGEWNEDKKGFCDFRLIPTFESNEACSYDEMEKRVNKLVREIVG